MPLDFPVIKVNLLAQIGAEELARSRHISEGTLPISMHAASSVEVNFSVSRTGLDLRHCKTLPSMKVYSAEQNGNGAKLSSVKKGDRIIVARNKISDVTCHRRDPTRFKKADKWTVFKKLWRRNHLRFCGTRAAISDIRETCRLLKVTTT
ncbi:hypothetical protein CDAR_318891 [Caerostris darwini]|uniref:Uncharacterized protein n=1 Tax=Caerostris darwini TaxID=1538125 RepID=A0AAV4TVB3_9ARAC|nr:hypothetical protein CDAR_318891 [Caerostris darwini]